MKVTIDKLLWIPSLFEDEPELLHEILKKDITKLIDDPNDTEFMRPLYTKCNCEDGDFYWQDEKINNTSVEVFACGGCQQWSMSVTY